MPLRTSSAATNTIGKPCVLSSPLDADERRSLKRCERVIARGAKAFIAVGLALSEIKERRLYREEFPTFEAYCQARLNCSRSLGYRLITHAAMVIEMGVSPIGDKLGTESQARELAWVPREVREEVLRLADELAELPIPPDWPQFGLELSAGWARRGWQGSIAHTRLDIRPNP